MRGLNLGRLCVGLAGLSMATVAAAAPAVNWPDWDIAALCGHDSARGQCALFEREARRALSGGWDAVPPEMRSACLGEVKSPYDKSYRLLSSCLEHKVLRGLDRDLIDTAGTAAKILPARTVVAAAPPAPPPAAAPAPKPAVAAPAPAAAPVVVAQAITWPYLDPAAPAVAEEANARAAIAAELAAQTAARQKAEAAATTAAPPPASPAAAAPTVTQAIVWPYVEPSAPSVAEEAKRRAAIAAELAALTAAREKAEAAAAAKPAEAAVPSPFAWPYVDPADASVAEEAKRRAAIAAELKAAADARAKAEADARQAAQAAAQATLAAANKKREEARACQGALDAAAKSGVIQFKSSSAVLEAKSTATLDRLAAAARSCGNLKIRIAGHTDSTGPADRNQKLSEDRARAVADYLAGKGVPAAGLESAGFGATKPVASNDAPAGRAKNRRIEFTVSGE